MKSPILLIFLCALLTWTGCDDDDNTLTTLNYDGANVTAPQLQAGTNTFAAYFPASETEAFAGRTLERISFYVSAIPLATRVIVRAEGPDARTPGDLLYERDISSRVTNLGWYEDRIASQDPIVLSDSEGIWLLVETEVDDTDPFSIGCDAGRNYSPNGDLLLFPGATQYGSFRDISGTETVNWNIRGILAAE